MFIYLISSGELCWFCCCCCCCNCAHFSFIINWIRAAFHFISFHFRMKNRFFANSCNSHTMCNVYVYVWQTDRQTDRLLYEANTLIICYWAISYLSSMLSKCARVCVVLSNQTFSLDVSMNGKSSKAKKTLLAIAYIDRYQTWFEVREEKNWMLKKKKRVNTWQYSKNVLKIGMVYSTDMPLLCRLLWTTLRANRLIFLAIWLLIEYWNHMSRSQLRVKCVLYKPLVLHSCLSCVVSTIFPHNSHSHVLCYYGRCGCYCLNINHRILSNWADNDALHSTYWSHYKKIVHFISLTHSHTIFFLDF